MAASEAVGEVAVEQRVAPSFALRTAGQVEVVVTQAGAYVERKHLEGVVERVVGR